MYIQKIKEHYKENIIEVKRKIEISIPQINKLFCNTNFEELIFALEEADKNVVKHHKEYLKTNEVWDKMKNIIN